MPSVSTGFEAIQREVVIVCRNSDSVVWRQFAKPNVTWPFECQTRTPQKLERRVHWKGFKTIQLNCLAKPGSVFEWF
jgi:hypothetical protein